LKAYAKAEAATDGDVLVLLVVTFLRRTPRCMMTARVGALLPIEEMDLMEKDQSACRSY